ncbi:hypothetical protein JIG36_07575 [Actinoplanes sp. LDG1-06]|uniref:SCO6045-like C-terminal domain-containing protein n=1 Tax=Paractinoplanes ovalisporus TaxID=2810368 RepID=A0ABS2A6G9_9ACTN|nr:hypothetical protein [Actinoplanes ovalisporus]MBM2615423.1 hypothetical protein [Actinoplanes ovalisporus]
MTTPSESGPADRGPVDPAVAPGLAARQAALVDALTAGSPMPEGIDPFKFEAARVALLRKRAGEVARQWPMLAAAFGDRWKHEFATWAATRPTQGSLRDGWDMARSLAARNALPAAAAVELAEREAAWHYNGTEPPRSRRTPALHSTAGATTLQLAGRVWVLRRP